MAGRGAVWIFNDGVLDKSRAQAHNFNRRIKSENASGASQTRRSLKISEVFYVFRSVFHFGGLEPPFCL